MQTAQRSLFTRDDTFFGVCEALGEDLRIPANLLRVALAGLLFWNPAAAIGGYAAAGLLVLATRLLFPKPRLATVQRVSAEPVPQAAPEQLVAVGDRVVAEPLLEAA